MPSPNWHSNSFGVSIAQTRDHHYNSISGLKENRVSLSTIHRLFQAPYKHFQSSARYKGSVNAMAEVK